MEEKHNLKLHKDVAERVQESFRNLGYSIQCEVRLYRDFVADIVAEKDQEKELIEVKTTRESAISNFVNRRDLIFLPNISFVSLAIPNEEIRDDLIKIAERVGYGLYSVSTQEVIQKVQPRKLPAGDLSCGGSFPNSVAAGRSLELQVSLTARNKIFTNIKVGYLIGYPFFVPIGETIPKILDEALPDETVRVSMKVGVSKDARPGTYTLFIERKADNLPLSIDNYEIAIRKEDAETVKKDVINSIVLMHHAVAVNLENTLARIDEAMLTGIVNIQDNVKSDSVWAIVGNFCLQYGLYSQAQSTYERMLRTIQEWEQKHNETLHKGLAFYNLGVALYHQGKILQAKDCFRKAYEEDKRTSGEQQANVLPAKKALQELFKEQ